MAWLKDLADWLRGHLFAFIDDLDAALEAHYPSPPEPMEQPTPQPQPEATTTPPTSVQVPVAPVDPWSIQKGAWHATRVICDDLGMSILKNVPVYKNGLLVGRFALKDVLCACIYQESRFRNRYADGSPVINQNKDAAGTVWSADYGIVQVNDHFHIGPGKDFPSVAYVMDNPHAAVRWMAEILQETGKLEPWSSYADDEYQQWLVPNSPMWVLAS